MLSVKQRRKKNNKNIEYKILQIKTTRSTTIYFFYKEDVLTYKNLQKYATKYIHMYNMKYNKNGSMM